MCIESRKLKAMKKRDAEIDHLFERIYEDNLSGKIDDRRYQKMSESYEAEQADLSEQIEALQLELERENDQSTTTEMFVATVRKYKRARKLTKRMLNELIDYIEVYQAEKIYGKKIQKLRIHYNCVGTLEIPDILPLAEPDVQIQTRKGVALNYSFSQKVSNLKIKRLELENASTFSSSSL